MKPALKSKSRAITKQPTPIGIIDQSDPNQNSTLISKMMGLSTSKIVAQQPFRRKNQSSNFHGGGFNLNNNSSYTANVNNNYEQTLSKIAYQNASHIQPPMQPTHLYEQLGITTTSGVKGNRKHKQNYNRSKYRQDDEPGQTALSKIDAQIEQMNNQRRQKFKNMQMDNWTYKIADQPNRQQYAVHVQSSLQQINLQSVQAKLQAHRLKMRQVQEEYHAKVGKVFDPSSRYLDAPKFQPQNNGIRFNIDIDKDFAQLDAQKGRIYELAKIRQNKQPQQIDLDQLWQQKKLSNPKLAEYDKKYKEYLLEKQARGLISCAVRERLFTWDKYIQPGHSKKKVPFHGVPSLHRHINSKSKSEKDEDSPKKAQKPEYGNINSLGQVLATKNDTFIASYIMAQIDKEKRGLISKQQLYEFMKNNEKILRGYNIDMKWLFTDLDNYETNRKGMLNKKQIAKFLALLEKVMHPSIKIQQSKAEFSEQFVTSKNKYQAYTTTFPKNKYLFEKLFTALDLGDDKLIKRQQFIDSIYTDSQISQIIDKEAINIIIIGRTITYRQIIGAILDDYRNQKNEKIKRSKQYITFGRFCQYFEIPQSLDLKKLQRHRKKQKKDVSSSQQQIMDLPSEYLQIMKDIASTIPRVYQDYITSIDFVQSCLRDPQILAISQQLCRIQSIQTKLPIESIHSTLTRMLKQCDQYSTWDELKMFLSRRGRPLNWDFQIICKKKALRQNKIKQHAKNISPNKIFNRTVEVTDAVQGVFRNNRKSLSKQKIKYGDYDKYTIPKPFNITDQQKKAQGKYKSLQKSNQFEELKGKFKANPVNRQILQPKPQLIQGKRVKKEQQKPDYYKYQNYQNDRIQRALKKAQQKFELEQQIKTAKQKTQVKARSIGIDLTKKYNDVIKQQQKKKRQQSQKKKPTNPSVSKNLYPDDPANLVKKKLQKVEQNMQKANQIVKKKQQLKRQQQQRLKGKNKQIQQHLKRKKKQQDEQRKVRQNIDKPDFKPKINKRELSQAEKQAIQQNRQERQRKKRETQQKIMQAQQERKKKILTHETKDKKLEIQGLDEEQILARIDEVDLQDLLLNQIQKQEFRKQIKVNVNKVNQMKQKYQGMAGRQRAALENQERRIMEQRKKLKQIKQIQKVGIKKETFSNISQKGEKSGQKSDLEFHRSKALRRYRAIMQGKQPLSQFDKYSVHNNIQKNQMQI